MDRQVRLLHIGQHDVNRLCQSLLASFVSHANDLQCFFEQLPPLGSPHPDTFRFTVAGVAVQLTAENNRLTLQVDGMPKDLEEFSDPFNSLGIWIGQTQQPDGTYMQHANHTPGNYIYALAQVATTSAAV